jgi:hypothetical protein
MATLFHTSLSASNHLYVEYSNETWNTGFTQNAYVTAQGLAQWPGASGSEANRSFMGMRTAQIADIWKSVWGPDFSRVTVVLGAQAANPWTATESLKSPLWTGTGNGPASAHPIGAVAIAPYFGENNSPLSWLTMSQSAALTLVFNQITNGGAAPNGYPGGSLKQASDWEAAYAPALAPYQLPLLAYEAGQTLTSINTWINDGSTGPSDAFQALYTTANRDSRMGSAYTTYLNQWKANGGQLFMHFVDASSPAIWGEWGALESFLDTTSPLSSSPPKWNALQSFIANNPCWWPNCAGTVGSSSAPSAPTPNPPTNLTVQ